MCPACKLVTSVIRKGFFAKKSTRTEKVQRYLCKGCHRYFSDQTGSLTYRERKPHLDQPLFRLLVHGVSQRACATILGCHKNTVDRKLCRLGVAARQRLKAQNTQGTDESEVVFDEMETFEHTKCKPISIALAVAKKTRKIIAIQAASMPAKGKLASISRRKYGIRRDDRFQALEAMACAIKTYCSKLHRLLSDQCPRYPRIVALHFPNIEHATYKGRRGCVVGQGELKRGGFDPLFSLNHTAAMLRDRIKRLARRTWCTTKRLDRLQCLLDMYAFHHNESLNGVGRLIRI